MDLYCKVYLDSTLPTNDLVELLTEGLGGQHRKWTITTNLVEVYVDENEDFDDGRRHNPDNGFLFYPYYVDMEPKPDVPADSYIDAVRRLLAFLKGQGIRAVAACDFEHLLPQEL